MECVGDILRFLIRFSYDGSNYQGYQRQKGFRTIQQELEEAATKVNAGKKVVIVAAGRTDKGVHAFDQVAHLDIDVNITPYKLKRALNSNLSNEIHVISAKEVVNDFHVRYKVKKKEYRYYINMGEFSPVLRNYVYQHGYPLNVLKMKQAIKCLVGQHDFRAFVTENVVKDNCIRTIYEAKIEEVDNHLIITFVGNGFLRYQVRNMVGALLKVGTGKLEPLEVKEMLESKVRGKNGATAKACGLYLVKTTLDGDI